MRALLGLVQLAFAAIVVLLAGMMALVAVTFRGDPGYQTATNATQLTMLGLAGGLAALAFVIARRGVRRFKAPPPKT
jgi:hypothetical protein